MRIFFVETCRRGQRWVGLCALLFLFIPISPQLVEFEPQAITVLNVSPAAAATEVDPTTVNVRIEFSQQVDFASVSSQTLVLLDAAGAVVEATYNQDVGLSVVSLFPVNALRPNQQYRVEVRAGIQGTDGSSTVPFASTFMTGSAELPTGYKFTKTKLIDQRSTTSVAIGPDGELYSIDAFGSIRRHVLSAATGEVEQTSLLYEVGGQSTAIAFDPTATATNLVLWVTYVDDCVGSYFNGRIVRLVLPADGSTSAVQAALYVDGLPHSGGLPSVDACAHQPNGLRFGADGYLYQSVGGVATLGGSPTWGQAVESIMSAAVIRLDVNGVSGSPFNAGNLPLNVDPTAPNNYDPFAADAPIKLYATGFRNMYDIVQHPNGFWYGATNANSVNGVTPDCGNGRAINVRPNETFHKIVPNHYYGHPNPARDECVLFGGNPTNDADPFEMSGYAVGTQPEPTFDPELLWDIRPNGGNSANGIDVFTGEGPLNNRLILAYYTGWRSIMTIGLDDNGDVTDFAPLTNESGAAITFDGALDVIVHPETNRLYVAEFGQQNAFGVNGKLYLLDPISESAPNMPWKLYLPLLE